MILSTAFNNFDMELQHIVLLSHWHFDTLTLWSCSLLTYKPWHFVICTFFNVNISKGQVRCLMCLTLGHIINSRLIDIWQHAYIYIKFVDFKINIYWKRKTWKARRACTQQLWRTDFEMTTQWSCSNGIGVRIKKIFFRITADLLDTSYTHFCFMADLITGHLAAQVNITRGNKSLHGQDWS